MYINYFSLRRYSQKPLQLFVVLFIYHFPFILIDLVGWSHQAGLQPGPVERFGDNVPAEGAHKTLSSGGQKWTYTSEKVSVKQS